MGLQILRREKISYLRKECGIYFVHKVLFVQRRLCMFILGASRLSDTRTDIDNLIKKYTVQQFIGFEPVRSIVMKILTANKR